MWPFRRKAEASLRGAPGVQRVKTYSAETGYVWQYVYDGYRDVLGGRVYVFSASADRKTFAPVSIAVHHKDYAAWERAQGRTLGSNEVFAIAKLGLFRFLDETPPAGVVGREFRVGEELATAILETLDL